MPGEFDFIQWLRQQQTASDFVRVPLGDDLAVLKWDAADLLLVGVDQVLDGVHFDSAVHSPRAIGRKVMNRNLSDCAAMACLPVAAVVAAALPTGTGLDYAKEIYLGLRDAADPFDCKIVGGDTGSWPGKLAISVTILGKSAGITPITRRGAKPGDGVYVTGPLGGSILGRHMTFEPRVHLARKLAQSGVVTAMLDISDGLSRDLRQICDLSGVGAIIDAAKIPIRADAIELAKRGHFDPLEHALHDGEDHELLLTASADPAVEGVVKIGQIIEGREIQLHRNGRMETMKPRGWEHSLGTK